MKVALYARTAIARPSEDFYSLRGQIAELNEWAETLHHQIVAIYEEVGSGISEERPEFNRMMTDAISAKHPFDAIVVCSMSRFTRDAYVFERSQARLQHAGVRIISTTPPATSGSENCNGNLQRTFIDIIVEYVKKTKNSK